MIGIRVRVDGTEKLSKSLRRAARDMSDLTAPNRRLAALVRAEARRRCPVRPGSGALQATIRVRGARRRVTMRAGSASVPYAGPIHWGWPDRGIRAQRFLYDAAHDTEAQWVGYYTAHVTDTISRVKGTT